MGGAEKKATLPASRAWFSRLLGLAILAAVIISASRISEERKIIQLLLHARPLWLGGAFLLQAGTYWAQGAVWRSVIAKGDSPIAGGVIYRLALAKLFVDQALPSAGISGTTIMARSLEERGVPRKVVMAAVAVSTSSYYFAYIVGLFAALAIGMTHGHVNGLITGAATIFAFFGLAVASLALTLAGRGQDPITKQFSRLPVAGKAFELFGEADRSLAHSVSLILQAVAFQLTIIALDAATMWMLIRSLGEAASVPRVFASFMISTLLRTLGVIPGGLGTFEAASVITLKLAGISVPVALSATLLFRGVSFWLPMIPGLVFSRTTAIRASESKQAD